MVPLAIASPLTGLTQSAESVLGNADWPLDMAQIKEHIRANTALGQEPVGVKAWINSQLLPQVQQTALEVQAEADRAEQGVTECKSLLWSAEKEVSHREGILERDESDRFKCLATEHRLHKEEMDACGDLKFMSELVVKSQPKSLGSLTNRTVEEVENILRESQQFFGDYFPKMLDKQELCGSATEAAANGHAECAADEEVIEGFYCTMKYGRDQACAQYAECYEEKSKAFDKTMDDVKDLEAHTKARFQKLTCFSKMGDNDDASAVSNCDAATVNVAHLAVSYPSKPQKQTCIHLMKTRRTYTSVECKEGSVVPHGDQPATDSDGNSTADSANASNASLLSK